MVGESLRKMQVCDKMPDMVADRGMVVLLAESGVQEQIGSDRY